MIIINHLRYIFITDPRAMVLSIGLVIFIKVIELARPWVLSKVIDLIVGHQSSEVMTFLGFFVGIAFLSSVLIPIQKLVSSQLLEKSRKRKSLEWNSEILNKNQDITRKIPAAKVTEAFYRARYAFAGFSYQLLEGHLINSLVVLVILGYILFMKMFWILPVILLNAALIAWISKAITQKIEPLHRELHVLGDRFKSHLADLYENALTIQLTGFQKTATKPLERAIQKHHSVMTDVSFWQVVIVSSSSLVIWLMQGIILVIGTFFLKSYLDVSAGSILGAYFYSSILIEKIKELSNLYMDSSRWQTSQESLLKLLNDQDGDSHSSIMHSPDLSLLDLTIHPFCIKMGDKNLTLKEPLTIPYGSKVGVVGESGSGKTFIAELLSGCNHHQNIVTLSDVDVACLSPESRGKIFSYGEAECQMLSGTLAQSVFFGKQIPENIISLLKDLKLEKYYSIAAAGELLKGNLSAGEKKRFELLKTIAYPSPITILDAPTESLNTDLVRHVWQLVKSRFDSGTLICTTHNEELISDFDLIIFIEKGVIRYGKNRSAFQEYHESSE